MTYEIEPNYIYKFVIEDQNYLYHFQEDIKDILQIYSKDNSLETSRKNLYFEKGEIIYANYLLNLKETIKIKINSIPIYDKLNSFETINEGQYFSIKSEEDSIAYFDSIDKNSKIFISETEESSKFESIIGDFFTCPKNQIYFIKVELFDTSVLKKYFHPLNINGEINIKNDESNFLYLQQSKSYILNFEGNTMNKMIKLSDKASNAEITIFKDEASIAILTKYNPYYEIGQNYNGKLTLEIKNANAFIEFLTEGNAEILEGISLSNYQLKSNAVNIILNETQKSFRININSNTNIKYSLSLGISNKNNFYYTSSNNKIITSEKKELTLQYLAPFKYLNLIENEFLSIYINFEREEQDELNITYSQFSDIDELLDLEMNPGDCEEARDDLADILDLYVYLDIAKNPPEIEGFPNYHHEKIDMMKEIKNIEINNRKFYEFYQQMEKILTATRDLHFNVLCLKVDKINLLYEAHLPFKFIIGDWEGKKRIFIEKNDNFDEFDQEIKSNIESHLNTPLKKINNLDPFDYIQNWSQYSRTKNPHAQFTHVIGEIPSFYLLQHPVYYWNLTLNDYEFEDNFILRLSYKIAKPKSANGNEEEFNQFFSDYVEKSFYTKKIPPIKEIKENFLIHKGINKPKKILKENKVEWDVIHEEKNGFLKCKVDNDNKFNVVIQNSFNLESKDTTEKIFKCAELFHSNNYPIIIIETKNGGGNPNLSLLMIQLFQMREVERTYTAYRISDFAKHFYQKDKFNYVNPETCGIIKAFEEFEEEKDHYDNDGLNVEHNRTKPFIELLSLSQREALNNFRKEFINSTNLKRPTDIIIFTDSFSYSATSTFIKGFQNIGGAITVGYFGNPKIEGTDLFDASQSDSGVISLGQYPTGNMVITIGITNAEIFNDLYQGGNPIPREYQLNPVDDRVDIYSEYSDDLYQKFIDEGKKIHKKFNEDNYCNSNDTKLIFHDNNNCYDIPNKENAHGGYVCGSNNQWDKTKCVPYYCDIGYYYDLYKGECIEECKSGSKSIYLHEKTFSEKYTVKKSETYEFFTVNSDNCYMFKSSEDNLYVNSYKRTRIMLMRGSYNHVIINPEKNALNDFQLEIKSFKSDFSFSYIKGKSINVEEFFIIDEKLIFIIQLSQDHILSLSNVNNVAPNKIKYGKYKEEMNYENIINGDEKYFQNYPNKIIKLEKDEIYFLYLDFSKNEPTFLHISFEPLELDNTIQLVGNSKNFIYLQKDKKYNLEFKNMRMKTMLKLSKQTIKSEINITTTENNENIQINATNYYYEIPNEIDNNNITLVIEASKEDAFIEILFKESKDNQVDILDFEQKNFELNKKYNLISIPKKYSSNIINFEIKAKKNDSSYYIIYQGYSLFNFTHIPNLSEEELTPINNYNLEITEPYKDKNEFMDDEYYTVMIILAKGNLDLKIQTKEKDDNTDPDENKEEFPGWAIALIVVGGVIVISLAAFLIWHYCGRCKN